MILALTRGITMSVVISLFCFSACLAAEEDLAITTYFPAPVMVYKSVRLLPKLDPPGACTATKRGMLYYSNNTSTGEAEGIKICNGTDWVVPLAGGPELWDYNVSRNAIFPLNNSWSVVVGAREAQVYDENTGTLVAPSGPVFQVNGSIARYGAEITTDDSTRINLAVNGRTVNPWPGSTIAGGESNQVFEGWSTIAGGGSGFLWASYSAIAGYRATALPAGDYSFMGGGGYLRGSYCVILGASKVIEDTTAGWDTYIGGANSRINSSAYGCSLIAGGYVGSMRGCHDAAMGGAIYTCNASDSVVSGNYTNASAGVWSFVGGNYSGTDSTATFAFGDRAQAVHDSAFVFSDGSSPGVDFTSQGAGTFNIRAVGGIRFSDGGPHAGETPLKYFDVAEFMDAAAGSSLQAGDLVSVGGKAVVDRSRGAGDQGLIGVVSGKKTCSFFMGAEGAAKSARRVPVSLAGAVYARVSDESGPVSLGDPITSSRQPGVGKKAVEPSKIVGFSMQDEDFKDARVKDVLVFVSAGYYCPEDKLESMREAIASLEKEARSFEKK